MAGTDAKVSAPYLGNSTTAKTMVAGFASISHGYVEFLHTSQKELVRVNFFGGKPGSMTIYVLH